MARGWLTKLRRLAQLHSHWLVVQILGEDALSKYELAALKSYGKLPLGDVIGLVEKSYVLGRLRAVWKDSDYKKLNYEQLVEEVENSSFTAVEKLAIQEAKLHAATNIKRIADDIAAGAFSRLSAELSTVVTEAMIEDLIRDETALALKEKKTYQELASSLMVRLKTDWSRDWELVAVTELHRAKTRGVVMAIVSKLDVFKTSDGVNSNVSIIPSDKTCIDCGKHYLDAKGNPKIFKLKDLLSAGSNGDPGVSHKRGSDGSHSHWKTTLPPAHPRCACRVVYVPPGMGWKAGKLEVLNKSMYEAALKKAVDTSTLKATIKPPGPQSTQTTPAVSAAKSPPSISGAPAPGNVAGPGRPSSGPQVDWEYYKGEGQPPASGGWQQSPNSGKWRRPVGSGGGATGSGKEEAERPSTTPEEAKNWKAKEVQTVLSHLGAGDIVHSHKISDKEGSGINDSFRVTIDGNGRGIMKAAQKFKPGVAEGKGYTEGVGTVPHKTNPQNEQGAYHLFNALGLDHCPPTTQRTEGGEAQSVQQWQEGKVQALAHLGTKFGDDGYSFSDLLNTSKDPLLFKKQMDEITITDLIMNSQDRHMGNLMIDEDLTEVKAIDHGVSFGSGMMGFKSSVMRMMASGGHKLKMPEHLQERFGNTTHGDLTRALGDTHKDWQISQTFLRMQYMLHLQETDGHLDYKKFQPYMYKANEDWGIPDSRMWVGDVQKQVTDHYTTPRSRPNELFEDFAIDWMDKHSTDSSSKHHEAAKSMKESGVFMGPGHASNPAAYRQSGEHKKYEQNIRSLKTGAEQTKQIQGELAKMPTPFANTRNKKDTTESGTLTKGLYLADPGQVFLRDKS